MGLRKKKSTL